MPFKNDIDRITEKFINSFGSLNESQLNWKPDKNVWSIAQNIAHLIQLNSSYFKNFDEIKGGKHVIPETDALQSFAIRSLQTLKPYTNIDRLERASTWSIWQPAREEFGAKNIDRIRK